ncbi:MAG TPA: hypothetical protein VHV31_05485 [Nitrolancea sp.]|nr:hypothetical protein [Nitrolancea sp.]
MIVRISSEGQYRLDSSHLNQINHIDNQIVAAIDSGDRERFVVLFRDLLALVRNEGEPVPHDELLESQVVLPPPDTTFDEAAGLFVADGLVPESE